MMVWKCNKCFYTDKTKRDKCICGGKFIPIEMEEFVYEAMKRTNELK